MNRLKLYGYISGAGLTLVAAVVVGILLGQYIDSQVGTSGIFTMLLIVIGTAGGVFNLLRVVGKISHGK